MQLRAFGEMMVSRFLWIGDNRHPEMRDAWAWARDDARGSHRVDLDEAVRNPVRGATRVVIARPNRQPQDKRFDRLVQQYPLARFATLCGSLCEGEGRTGEPWSGCNQIDWHRWSDALPRWCEGVTQGSTESDEVPSKNVGLIGIVVRRPQLGESLRDSLMGVGHATTLVVPELLRSAGPWRHLLWDDSLLPNGDNWTRWQPLVDGTPKHHWLVSAPRTG